jgi:hypothetical protein
MAENDILITLLTGIFYLVIAVLTFTSFFAVYVLLRYARNAAVALTASFLYGLFYLTIVNNAYQILKSL